MVQFLPDMLVVDLDNKWVEPDQLQTLSELTSAHQQPSLNSYLARRSPFSSTDAREDEEKDTG
jgi:hypothetical protein